MFGFVNHVKGVFIIWAKEQFSRFLFCKDCAINNRLKRGRGSGSMETNEEAGVAR